MQTFDLNDLVADSERAGQRWREFLRVPSLSMGLYRLQAGRADEQQPHTEDEVYVVLSGKAVFRAVGGNRPLPPAPSFSWSGQLSIGSWTSPKI